MHAHVADNENEDGDYEAWKVHELKRIKELREEREACSWEKENGNGEDAQYGRECREKSWVDELYIIVVLLLTNK